MVSKNLKEASKAKAKAQALNDKKDNDRTREVLNEKKSALNTAFINLSDSSKNFDSVLAELNTEYDKFIWQLDMTKSDGGKTSAKVKAARDSYVKAMEAQKAKVLKTCEAEYEDYKRELSMMDDYGFEDTLDVVTGREEPVPAEAVEGYRALMDSVFGEGKCIVLRVRPVGAVKVL